MKAKTIPIVFLLNLLAIGSASAGPYQCQLTIDKMKKDPTDPSSPLFSQSVPVEFHRPGVQKIFEVKNLDLAIQFRNGKASEFAAESVDYPVFVMRATSLDG